MAILFAMPKLGLNMVDGIIVRWLVREGEVLSSGQTILEIETDKAVQEVESPGAGILARILKDEGETVPCNAVMAVILAPGEPMPVQIPEMIFEGVAPKAEVEVKVESDVYGERAERETQESLPVRVPVSPAAKALAKELGVDLTKIRPRGSKITREDVEAAHQTGQADTIEKNGDKRQEMTSLRRKIAEHMSLSARSVARVALTLEVDATAFVKWREGLKKQDEKISYNVLLAKLVSAALKEFPYMNAQLEESAICLKSEINIGIAVDSERGLIVPVLRKVDEKNVSVLQKELDALVLRVQQGRSSLEDLQGGTFTITNLGSLDIESFLPVINFPEAAILGVGAILKKPVALYDEVIIQPRMHLTLAFDHRLIDGAPAARFLQRIKHLIEAAGS